MEATRTGHAGRSYVHAWDDITIADNTGGVVSIPGAPDRAVQVTGVFGGGSLIIEGSLDGINFSTLSDPQGNPLSFTSAGLEAIIENVLWLRPRLAGGDGTTTLNVRVFSRSAM